MNKKSNSTKILAPPKYWSKICHWLWSTRCQIRSTRRHFVSLPIEEYQVLLRNLGIWLRKIIASKDYSTTTFGQYQDGNMFVLEYKDIDNLMQCLFVLYW